MQTKVNIIRLKEGNILFVDGKPIVAQKDTVIILPIATDFYIMQNKISKIGNFYVTLQEKAYKRKWTQELHNIIIVPEDSSILKDTIRTQKSEMPFLKYRNMIIRNILFQKLDVFGPTIYTPNRQAQSWFGETANKIHIKTRNAVISNHLLFKQGESINPYVLADNERLLRALPFIEDACIKVENVTATGDSVDIIVITKDTWSLGLFFTTADFKNLNMDIWDNNILGSGMATENSLYRNPGKLPYTGLNGAYIIRNINGSFIDCKIGYSLFGSEGFNVDILRNFFTQRTKYAGELFYEKISTYTAIKNEQNELEYTPLKGTSTKLWIGRAFPLRRTKPRTSDINTFIISAGFNNNYFSVRPSVAPDFRYNYQNKTSYLLSYAFSNQRYYKSNLIYSFGRTEDIPYGWLIKFTHGFESNEFSDRFYNSFSISRGNYVDNIGYSYLNLALGGFIKKNKPEQGILKVNSSFYTNLLVLGPFKFRNFININYTKGYNRFNDELLNINDLSGIRGLENDSATGTQKLSLNLETVCFTPLYLAGFRFAVFGFADFAYIGKTTKPVFDFPLYSGFGMGIRIRNEKLVFKTFQVRLAFYPWISKNANGEFFTVTDEAKFKTHNFNAKSPEIIDFK